jgi:2-keto-4-pentenoate hydratase/2-oxohepta-3-ene-1,7-dioic acid hydratase in catechol pathway
MKLFRHGEIGRERPGVWTEDRGHLDLSGFTVDFDETFFADRGIERLRAWLLEGAECPTIDPDSARFGAPVTRPSKIIGVGLNYRDHVAETCSSLPSEPMIFMKATSAMCGPNDDVVLPRGSEHTDYEVELAVVIGTRGRYLDPAQALRHIAGFTVCIDYSEREWQKNRSGQFVKGKSSDTFAPIGPYLVPADEIESSDLRLQLAVNGEPRQDSTTAHMIFDVPTIVASISEYMTLLPGDVITTGTPSGVGLGFDPPRFLRAGDIVEYSIDGIGDGRQEVVASPIIGSPDASI